MVKKPFFAPVEVKVDFPQMERDWLIKWYKEGTVKDYLQKNNKSLKYFSFLDGPITANNPMGVHHAWGRTYKDLWQRYYNMQGYKQRFQNGFDCQGLWVEVEVEKELGFKSKKEIGEYGIEKFVEKCKDRVFKYAAIQTEQSKRLGNFMDWDNSYYTLSDENNYMIWHFLKVCHNNNLIYKGKDVVPWCPRCETAISQHEILTEDYKDVTHEAVYLALPIKGRKDEYLLVWTTTPWTIPANIAVAVEGEMDYVLTEFKEKKYWVARVRLESVFANEGKIVGSLKGKELVGLDYSSPYDHLACVVNLPKEEKKNLHRVIATDPLIMPISTEEGTGLVHTSTGTGAEDYQLGKKKDLPVISAIDDHACYLPEFGDLSGKNAKANPRIVLDYLEKNGWVVKIEKYRHRYPVCWRCKEELVWKVTDEWYISMDSPLKTGKEESENKENITLREKMKGVVKNINWIPQFGLKRELDWLENMHDWLISKKNRYWGLALPIWECTDCGYFTVIGSKAELKKKAIEGWGAFSGKSPHKPQIDKVKIKCSNCDKIVSRIEPVGNPWLDAGIVAFSTISRDNKSESLYLHAKNEWLKWFPADFITESFPGQFKNWFYSLITMSTLLEGMEPAKTIFGFATLLAEDGSPMHKSAGNMIEFNEGADKIGVDVMRWMYLKQSPVENLLFGYEVADATRRRFHLKLWNIYNFFVTFANHDQWQPGENNVLPQSLLDTWILSRFSQTIEEVSSSLDQYDACRASLSIENFVDDLSNWYIRRSRERVGLLATNLEDKNSFYKTLYLILTTLCRLLAPFIPFMAEEIFTHLTHEKSVHLSTWPKEKDKIDLKLIRKMKDLREMIEKVHAIRKENKIPIRQPLQAVKVYSEKIVNYNNELIQLAKDELNLRKIIFLTGKENIELDTAITPELLEEAKARELIRMIQTERKKLKLAIDQPAKVTALWLPGDKQVLKRVMVKTSSKSIVKGEIFKVEV